MDKHPLLTSLESDSAVFSSLAASAMGAGHDPAVPCCEGWRLADLVRHLAGIHSLAAEWVTQGRRPGQWQREPSPGQSLHAWATACSDRLIDAVGTVDPATPCSTWSAYDMSVGFWVRRMAHETLVHRVDLEQSLGIDYWAVDPLIAVDGIDETLTLWLTGRMPAGLTGSGRTVRVVSYGPEDNVLFDRVIRPYHQSVHFSSSDVGPAVDAEVSGSASAVWAWCWGRSDAAHPIETVGDADAVDELRRILAAAQQ
ncbi:MAG: hypothetical protein QOD91_2041 [Frankiales bacterium]|nr:hypothetical protein [Frankiales bacterium]